MSLIYFSFNGSQTDYLRVKQMNLMEFVTKIIYDFFLQVRVHEIWVIYY